MKTIPGWIQYMFHVELKHFTMILHLLSCNLILLVVFFYFYLIIHLLLIKVYMIYQWKDLFPLLIYQVTVMFLYILRCINIFNFNFFWVFTYVLPFPLCTFLNLK